MKKGIATELDEVIFGSPDPKISRQLAYLEEQGTIRQIAPRLYTPNLTEEASIIVRRNLFNILGHLFPGALLSHRSAFEYKPTKSGLIFLTYKYTKKVSLPGVTIHFLEGEAPIQGDNKFVAELYVSQKARAFLENLQASKKTGPESKTLSLPEIEEKLELIIQVNGEEELNRMRDEARAIAAGLKMEKEFEKLNKIIGAMLSTNTSKILTSPIASARAFGAPYDPGRLRLFEELFIELQGIEFRNITDKNTSLRSFRNFAFFESYFSNYIEGTVFRVDEAKEIIETDMPLPSRNDDSHDILGTYHLVSKREEMSIIPTSANEYLDILQYRHEILLSARIDKSPGKFKDRNNFAGQTAFVDFKLVRGTLIKSFDFYNALTHPFARAAFIMFVVSEVHPFLDGNGRIARVMMNAELVKGGHSKIIIPTVYREDYMGALRKLTRQKEPGPYIRMLQRAQEFSANIFGEDYDDMHEYLINCNAFSEHTEARLKL